MPTYCYTTKDGQVTVERVYSIGKAPRRVVTDSGEVAYRDILAEHQGYRPTPANWPMTSYAAGVHPSQVPGLMKADHEAGVPTEYTKEGDPVFTGPEHRKRYCRVHGLFDRNAGYGDPSPRAEAG